MKSIGTNAHLALGLLLYTGQRRSDVVLLGRQHVHCGTLRFTQVKGRNRSPKRLELPILPELQKIIDASPTGTMTFLVTKFGKPFTAGASAIGFADDATRQDSLIAQHMGFERLVWMSASDPKRTFT